MSDNDSFEPLDNFPEGLHVDALPASEVRRRGDRMRRRNTALATVGGVVAAAVFIGVPVAVMSGGDDDGVDPAPQPTPTVTEEPAPTWLTEIPEDFPVTEGMTDEGEPAEGDTDAFALCETSYPTSPGTEVSQTWTYSGDTESTVQRTLQLWPDDVSADASLDQLVAAVQACPQGPTLGGEDVIESRLVDFETGGDRSVTFTQQVLADDGLVSQLTVVEVTQVGNAVLVDSSYGAAGGDDVIAAETVRLADRSAETRAAMCVFSAEACVPGQTASDPEAGDDSPTAQTTEEGVATIPTDFPLDTGLEADLDGEKDGPSPDAEGVVLTDLCATTAWPRPDAVERLAVRVTGPEYAEVRELVTFADADEAVAAMAEVRAAVAACPEAPADDPANDRTFTELEADTGYEDSVTFGQTYREGTGGGVYQFVRVGSAVLATVASGEYLPTSIQGGANVLTSDNRAVTEQMCLWTAAGCG